MSAFQIAVTKEDSALTRILKYAPAEVTGLYLLGKGYTPDTFVGTWALICLGLAVLLRAWPADRKWLLVVVSTLSFAMWVLAIGDPLGGLSFPNWVVSIAILVFTFVIPVVAPGK